MLIYLSIEASLDELAEKMRSILNIPDRNQSQYVEEQRRDNLSMGGIYYHFETFGLTLQLIKNGGEATLEESKNKWEYYMDVKEENGSLEKQEFLIIGKHLCDVFKKNGIDAEIEIEDVAP